MYDLKDLIMRCIDEALAGRHSKRYGKATSWDPDTHMVKVKLKPEGQETGWIPVHSMAAGNGYGLMTGIVTGDGDTTGEQLEITHQEGEFEAGAITSRVHSDQVAKPPKLESGEQLLLTPFKQFIKLAKDGSITITDAGGATVVLDGKANITISKAKKITVSSSDDIAITTKGNINLKSNKLTHNNHDVGSDHMHTNAGGSGLSGPPQ